MNSNASVAQPGEMERRLSFSGLIASNNRRNHLVRLVYFLNATIVLVGLGIITYRQNKGDYRCSRVAVSFDEEIWEQAKVRVSDDEVVDRLLIYPYFNGIYEEVNDVHRGYPKYIEQNKNDGTPFGDSVTGAEIIYCNDLGSWVFRHPDILTTQINEPENECSWLWKSPPTKDFDLLSSTHNGNWEAWVGEVKQLADMSIVCMECSDRSDCNYHGNCVNSKCNCTENYFGESCEFERPCETLATEKAHSFGMCEICFCVCNVLLDRTNLQLSVPHQIQKKECNGSKRTRSETLTIHIRCTIDR